MGGLKLLEPSAGGGAFVRHMGAAKNVTACEVDEELAEALPEMCPMDVTTKLLVWPGDFLRYEGWGEHDLVIMNPPYADDGRGEARDRLHVARAVRMAPRVVALVRANFVFGKKRFHDIFRWSRLTRLAILTRRPNCPGPSHRTDSTSPRHDFCVIEMVREEGLDRLQDPVLDPVAVEWWTDDWNLPAERL